MKDDIFSRRDFFKKSAKKILPIFGGVILSALPLQKIDAKKVLGCDNNCHAACQNSCEGECVTSCFYLCMGGCKGCRNACNVGCAIGCTTGCKVSCFTTCVYNSVTVGL